MVRSLNRVGMLEEGKLSESKPLATQVWAFVGQRVAAALRHLASDVTVAAYDEAIREVDLARREMTDQLAGNEEARRLIDRFDAAKNTRFGVEADFVYLQGLADGCRLAGILNDDVLRWFGPAYSRGWDDTAED